MNIEDRLIKAMEDNTRAVEESVRAIREMKSAIMQNDLDTATTKDACRIIGLKNPRNLKELRDRGQFRQDEYSKPGKEFVYKKSACYRIRELIFKGEIHL